MISSKLLLLKPLGANVNEILIGIKLFHPRMLYDNIVFEMAVMISSLTLSQFTEGDQNL